MATPRRPGQRHRDRRPALITIALLGVLGIVLVAATGVFGLAGSGGEAGAGSPGAAIASASPSPTGPAPSSAASPSSAPSSSAPPAPSPSASIDLADVPIVPVAAYRSTLDAVTAAETKATLTGTSKRFVAVELVADEADAILRAMGLERPAAGSERLVLARDAGAVATDLAAHPDRVGFMRADAVGPGVRALAWGADALFGVDRLGTLAGWPLVARLPAATGEGSFDPGATWTLVAGGDILLDRGIHYATRIQKKGLDFPFDGGVADITSRYCCSSFGWQLPRAKRIGGTSTVRHLLEDADLAIANFENPAPDKWRFHEHGTVFSAEPAKIAGLADAGLDWVSLANNHIRDAGGAAISQTRANLAKYGLRFGGAGKDLAEARKPSLIDVGGMTVAILAYDTVTKSYAATADRAGSAQLTAKAVRDDVRAARAAGADVVIVFPHWGIEYKATATKAQRTLAHAAIDAGADLVIGSHSHWAGAMEIYEGKPIWYSLGNFVFDQTWSEPTMEGLMLELTFDRARLVQARIRPHLILDRAQPNLLDPAGDGKVVMDRVFGASKGLLPW